jgi:hypothetical protein
MIEALATEIDVAQAMAPHLQAGKAEKDDGAHAYLAHEVAQSGLDALPYIVQDVHPHHLPKTGKAH